MASEKTIPIFTGKNNQEVEMVRVLLNQAGIEAHAMLDQAPTSNWYFGSLPNLHQPQVWIKESDEEQARVLLEKFQERLEKRNARPTGEIIIQVCEKCGHTNHFPANQNGTVQSCQNCFTYLDVGEVDNDMDWTGDEEESENQNEIDEENGEV